MNTKIQLRIRYLNRSIVNCRDAARYLKAKGYIKELSEAWGKTVKDVSPTLTDEDATELIHILDK